MAFLRNQDKNIYKLGTNEINMFWNKLSADANIHKKNLGTAPVYLLNRDGVDAFWFFLNWNQFLHMYINLVWKQILKYMYQIRIKLKINSKDGSFFKSLKQKYD